MKQLLLTLAFMAIAFNAYSQKAPSFITDENVKWREIHQCGSNLEVPGAFDFYDYEVRGDTTLNGKSFKKVYLSINGAQSDYHAAIRNYGNKLYCKVKNKDDDKEYILADFSWYYNKTLKFDDIYGEPYEIEINKSADYMEFKDGIWYDYLQLDDHWGALLSPSKDIRLIKNFGSTLGIFSYLLMAGKVIDCYLYNEIVTIRKGEELLYQSPYFSENGVRTTPPEGRWLDKGTKWTEITQYKNPSPGESKLRTYHFELKEGEYSTDGYYYWKVCNNGQEIAKLHENEEGDIYMTDLLAFVGVSEPEFRLYSFGKTPWTVGNKIHYAVFGKEGITAQESEITNLESYTLMNGEIVPQAYNIIYGIGNRDGIIEPLLGHNDQFTSSTMLSDYYRNGELLYRSQSTGIESAYASRQLFIRNEGGTIYFKLMNPGNRASLHIFRADGQKTATYQIMNGETSISDLPAGIYLYRLISNRGAIIADGQFIVNK